MTRVLASQPPPANTSSTSLFQCPACNTPYPLISPEDLSDFPDSCPACGSPVLQKDGYIDLTGNPSESQGRIRDLLTQPLKQSMFQLSSVSYAYERGWRSNFKRAGFPGIDKELEMFLDWAAPASIVLDMSCGSGLMARRLANCKDIGKVIAADYSESMLREAVAQRKKDTTAPEFELIRADVKQLPFIDNSFDAVHTGAALHCWPNVQDGISEVYRTTKRGGKVFATTFLKLPYIPGRDWLTRRKTLMRLAVRGEELVFPNRGVYRFFEKDELEFLFKAAGFEEVNVETISGCAIVRAKKPE